MGTYMIGNEFKEQYVPKEMILTYYKKMKPLRTVFEKEETSKELEVKGARCIGKMYEQMAKEKSIMSYSDLKAADTIDLLCAIDKERSIKATDYPAYHVTDNEQEYMSTHPFCIVPPLEKAVIKINKRRYLKYTLDKIITDTPDKSIVVMIEDYHVTRDISILDRAMRVEIFNHDGKVLTEAISRVGTWDIVNELVDYRKVFSKRDRVFWECMMLPGIKSVLKEEEEYSKSHDEVTYMNELDWKVVNIFIHSIVYTNVALSQNKARAATHIRSKVNYIPDESGKKPKKQIIRNVGASGITITSVDIPREATEERIIKYKVASWNTRGHERKLKSGRIVWVKQSVHHRKCLEKQEPLRTEILIKEDTQ